MKMDLKMYMKCIKLSNTWQMGAGSDSKTNLFLLFQKKLDRLGDEKRNILCSWPKEYMACSS